MRTAQQVMAAQATLSSALECASKEQLLLLLADLHKCDSAAQAILASAPVQPSCQALAARADVYLCPSQPDADLAAALHGAPAVAGYSMSFLDGPMPVLFSVLHNKPQV